MARIRWGMRLPLFSLAIASLILGIWLDFVWRATVFDTPPDLPRVAVVFTGQFDRVHAGLDLLSAGHVDTLFISGVNPRAGIRVPGFADQFELTAFERSALAEGRIILATGADNTVENAVETACWLRTRPDVEAVALVTSPWHMARASRALDRALWGVEVARVAAGPPDTRPGIRRVEVPKFIATWGATLLPRAFWVKDESQLC